MLIAILIVIAVLLLWIVRVLYQVCHNQVSAQHKTEQVLSQILNRLDKLNK